MRRPDLYWADGLGIMQKILHALAVSPLAFFMCGQVHNAVMLFCHPYVEAVEPVESLGAYFLTLEFPLLRAGIQSLGRRCLGGRSLGGYAPDTCASLLLSL